MGLWRYHGQAVDVIDRNGRVYRGIFEGTNQTRGLFLRSRFGRRRFFPFFIIAAVFVVRGRRRIF
ncbi:MAG TPA: hypothetical protein VNM69_05275 [Bacillus sp. (in: firmicutes)]|uniref:hypothetical protein n=1 Tax=Bacillus litorisediminis TaxID=2922713 RepID=UPI001FADBA8A|nr:hypothetical protein [Bacillus litorisediminis]HWO75319.1 hypothetical protein [Bacillus sp. (in: firmicutes)]